LFELAHLTRLALQNFDSTSGTAGISAAPVKYVDARIFESKHELFAVWGFGLNETSGCFCLDL
jgi:hypothetical protein